MNIEFDLSQDNTRAILARLSERLDRGLLVAGQEIVALASVLAPVDTGALARSGRAKLTAPHEVTVSFGSENDGSIQDIRAIAQEYGTIKNAAQPYLTPAIRNVDIGFFIKKSLNGLGRGIK